MKNIVLLLAVVFVSACTQYGTSAVSTGSGGSSVAANTFEMTSSGFNPSTLTVQAGTIVTFVNKDTQPHWPASGVHPTHLLYPELGGCIGSKFDACRGLQPGESWSFNFTKYGTWPFHDHLNPSTTGTITVK